MKRATTFATITIIVSALIIGCLASCNAVKQNQREHKKIERAKELLKRYKVVADWCSKLFPAKDSIIKGETTVHFDTLYMGETEFITEIVNDTVYITKTLPPKVIKQTFTRSDTIVRVDMAKVEAMRIERDDAVSALLKETEAKIKAQNERDEWKKKARKRNLFLIIAVTLFVGWQFRGRIFPLISKLLK
jgi:hypothetical protein